MTAISYIGRVPGDEMKDRGAEVTRTARSYIPYTTLTEGEMRLALLREQAAIMTAAYPDFPQYAQALAMIDNALGRGISNGVAFIGQVPDSLQDIARAIAQASELTGPAAADFYGREKLNDGVNIGADPIVPTKITESCNRYATRLANNRFNLNLPEDAWRVMPSLTAQKKFWLSKKAECELQKETERVLNETLERASHHVLYKDVAPGFAPIAGSRMDTKRLLHIAGIGGLASAATVSPAIMKEWTEVGVLRQNAAVGVGPMSSVNSGFLVATDGNEQVLQQYLAWSKTRPGAVSGIGEPITATVIAITGAIVSALGAAAALIAKLNESKRLNLQAQAQGFGTPAYSAEVGDFSMQPGPGGSGAGINPWLIAAGAAALYFVTRK